MMVREEHRMRMCDNMVLRRILRHKKDEVTGKWKKLHDEELYNLCSQNVKGIIKMKGVIIN
jgi:hypothetical protein